MHRQFVLPIALHKAIGSRRFTLSVRAASRPAGPAAASSDRRSRSSPNGARPRNRRDGVHGRPPGARASLPAGDDVRALVREPDGAPDLDAAGIELASATSAIRPRSTRRRPASTSSITSPPSTGRRVCRPRPTVRSTRPPSADRRSGRRARRRATRRALQHRRASTATSSIRRPTKTRRCSPATSTRSRSSKVSGWRARPARGWASRSRSCGRPASTVPAIGGC